MYTAHTQLFNRSFKTVGEAAIKHNSRKEMLRIENRSDQKTENMLAVAARGCLAAAGICHG